VAVEFAADPDVADLAHRTAAFIREVVIPFEQQHPGVTQSDPVRVELQQAAKNAVSQASIVATRTMLRSFLPRSTAAAYAASCSGVSGVAPGWKGGEGGTEPGVVMQSSSAKRARPFQCRRQWQKTLNR